MSIKKTVNKKVVKIINDVKQLCGLLFGNNLQDVFLYGSYARGDYKKYSDIDILITVNMSEKQLMKYRSSISDIEHKLMRKYDIMALIAMVPAERFTRFANILPFYRNVMTEGINYGTQR